MSAAGPRDHVTRVREVAPKLLAEIEDLDLKAEDVHRDNPFAAAPDFINRLSSVLDK